MAHVEAHPWVDPIVDEVRAARDALAARHGYDIDRIAAAMTARSLAAGRKTAASRSAVVAGDVEPAKHSSSPAR